MTTVRNLKEWKDKRTSEGLCYHCGKPLDNRFRMCNACLGANRERNCKWQDRMRTEGRCMTCGEINDTPQRRNCSKCSAVKSTRTTEKQARANANGICSRCYKRPLGKLSTIYCDICYPIHLETNRKTHNRLNFDGNRYSVLERDNNLCVACGSDKLLEVHHIDRNRTHNTMDNLITLCSACHATLTKMMCAPNLQFLIELCKGASVTFS